MKLLKSGIKLALASLIICAIAIYIGNVSYKAESKYESDGAYRSELLVWEQKEHNEGKLYILGHSINIDLTRLSNLKEDIYELMNKISNLTP